MKRKVIWTIHLHDFGVQNRSQSWRGVCPFLYFVSFNITSKRGWTWQVLLLEEHQLDMVNIPLFTGFWKHVRWLYFLGISEASTWVFHLLVGTEVWTLSRWKRYEKPSMAIASPSTKGGTVFKGPWSTQDEWEWWWPSILSRWYDYFSVFENVQIMVFECVFLDSWLIDVKKRSDIQNSKHSPIDKCLLYAGNP